MHYSLRRMFRKITSSDARVNSVYFERQYKQTLWPQQHGNIMRTDDIEIHRHTHTHTYSLIHTHTCHKNVIVIRVLFIENVLHIDPFVYKWIVRLSPTRLVRLKWWNRCGGSSHSHGKHSSGKWTEMSYAYIEIKNTHKKIRIDKTYIKLNWPKKIECTIDGFVCVCSLVRPMVMIVTWMADNIQWMVCCWP